MIVALSDLAYLSDLQLFKTIISSADRFPGLYRFDPKYGGVLEREHFLKLIDLFEVSHLATSKNRRWFKDEWLSAHKIIHDLSYGPEGRNEQRREENIKTLLSDRYENWIHEARRLSLCAIDTQNRVSKIEIGKTYYIMGSLLRFQDNEVLVSFDAAQKKSALTLRVPFEVASNYIAKTFSAESLNDLFWRAEVLSLLEFSEDPEEPAHLQFDAESLVLALAEFDPGSPIIAAVADGPLVPIRFAKFIGVSSVNRQTA
jgi:hypothetical protein